MEESDPYRVVILSPYSGDVEANIAYARECLKDSLARGEAPFVAHLLYTQVLDDSVPEDRYVGMKAGLAWMNSGVVDAVVIYTDRGFSRGMADEIYNAGLHVMNVVYRSIENPQGDDSNAASNTTHNRAGATVANNQEAR